MAIREIVQNEPGNVTRRQRMVRVIITEDSDLFAVWRVELPNGKRAERSIQVSTVLKDLIVARATFNTVLDQIRDDTVGRTGT